MEKRRQRRWLGLAVTATVFRLSQECWILVGARSAGSELPQTHRLRLRAGEKSLDEIADEVESLLDELRQEGHGLGSVHGSTYAAPPAPSAPASHRRVLEVEVVQTSASPPRSAQRVVPTPASPYRSAPEVVQQTSARPPRSAQEMAEPPPRYTSSVDNGRSLEEQMQEEARQRHELLEQQRQQEEELEDLRRQQRELQRRQEEAWQSQREPPLYEQEQPQQWGYSNREAPSPQPVQQTYAQQPEYLYQRQQEDYVQQPPLQQPPQPVYGSTQLSSEQSVQGQPHGQREQALQLQEKDMAVDAEELLPTLVQVGLRSAPEYGRDMFVASLPQIGSVVKSQVEKAGRAHLVGIQALQKYIVQLEDDLDNKEHEVNDVTGRWQEERDLRFKAEDAAKTLVRPPLNSPDTSAEAEAEAERLRVELLAAREGAEAARAQLEQEAQRAEAAEAKLRALVERIRSASSAGKR
mmetsp:Transcript_84342/g.149093  ORF Transcript_84342/g.149093 Transcript_84342/m.149093 type:complete len:466 (-) Transcript_84342:18-1415(-)